VEHHADFAVPVVRKLRVETSRELPGADRETVAGPVLALGWWVDPDAGTGDAAEPPTGVLYLVADERLPRPVWVKQADLVSFRVED
jgi:hypothetical protein